MAKLKIYSLRISHGAEEGTSYWYTERQAIEAGERYAKKHGVTISWHWWRALSRTDDVETEKGTLEMWVDNHTVFGEPE